MTASQASSSSIDAASRATWPIMGHASPASSASSATSGLATVSSKDRSYIAGCAPTKASDGSIGPPLDRFLRTGVTLRAPPGGSSRPSRKHLRCLDMDRLPTLTLSDEAGRDVRLGELWAQRPV